MSFHERLADRMDRVNEVLRVVAIVSLIGSALFCCYIALTHDPAAWAQAAFLVVLALYAEDLR